MPRRRRSRRTSKRRSSSASIFPRRRSRSKTPAWHWLLTGMLLGGLAILFLHMNASQGISGWSNANPSAASQEKYEFYQLLTKSDDTPAAEVVKQAQPALPVAVKKQPKTLIQSSLSLQIGAFTSELQANHLVTQIKNLRLPVRIAQADRLGKTWYRVLISPIESEKQAVVYQKQLAKIGIEGQLIW